MRFQNFLTGLIAIVALSQSYPSFAQNADQLSFVEKPVAIATENGTFLLNALVDWQYRSENNNLARFDTRRLIGKVSYSQQLENDWDVGASYEGDYMSGSGENYFDEFRVFIKDQWGSVSAGEIATELFDKAGRRRSVGLLGIDNDSFLLPLETWGIHYEWSSPKLSLLASIDESANTELGFLHHRVSGGYRLGWFLRANHTEDPQGNAQGVNASEGVALGSQLERGRWSADAQWMLEEIDTVDSNQTFSLTTFSMGLHYRFNRFGWSFTGISRENVLNNTERFVSLGLRMDVARGLSLNAGIRSESTKLMDEAFRTYALSIRYEI
ncbi:MAG: hypothetical protein KTR18_10260 [Acidiferrobacterales bacterium]|nr:hypothetical protein [Acidiferrobacterales bacterium]